MLLEFIEPREPELKKRYTSRQVNALKDEFALFIYSLTKDRLDGKIGYIYYGIRTIDAMAIKKRIEHNAGYTIPRWRFGRALDVSTIKRQRGWCEIGKTIVNMPEDEIEIAISLYIKERYGTEQDIYNRLKETHSQENVNTTSQ